MSIKRYYIILIIILLAVSAAHSHESCTGMLYDFRTDELCVKVDTLNNSIRTNKRYQDIEVHFRFDKYDLDLEYMGNKASLQIFSNKIDSIGISKIDSIVIVSQSSPEGVYEHNLMLSRNRANTMRKYILNHYPELKDRLYVYPDGESWTRLREHVINDTLMKNTTIDKVVSIIDANINIGTKKWRMEQLPVYRYLLRTYYPRIRNSKFCILYYSEIISQTKEPEPIVEAVEERIDTLTFLKPVAPKVEEWIPKFYIKTNAIGLGMGIANIAAEIDLAKKWSLALPIYYSAWNYFKSTIKFRTFAVQPELRYWPFEENDGFLVGAHFGLVYYNFAFDGDYRYQDHNRETPSIGGGLSVGYRLPIGNNKRWRVEFTIGAGVYSNHYDKFHNTSYTKDGQIIESIKKTYWGIDQAAISISYSFDINKKGDIK